MAPVKQPVLPVVLAQDQADYPQLFIDVAADHKVVVNGVFDFHPVPGPGARAVDAVPFLGYNALQPPLLRQGKQGRAPALDPAGESQGGGFLYQYPGQQLLAPP